MPQLLIPFIAAAFTSIGIGTGIVIGTTTWATVFASVIVGAALIGISALLISTPTLRPDVTKQPIRQSVAARRRYYGVVKASGVYAFLKAKGNWLYSIIMIASQEIDSIYAHLLNDVCVNSNMNGDGDLVSAPYALDGYIPIQMIRYRLGLDTQTPYAEMTTAGFNRPAPWVGEWTADHRLDGIFHVLFIQGALARNFNVYYPSGPYNYTAVFYAAKVFDPRNMYHDPDDKDTWEWTTNGALIVLDYMRHRDGMRLPWLFFENVLDDWANQADICDEDVGGFPRYRLCGGYEFTAPARDVLTQMLEPMGATVEMTSDGSAVLRVSRCAINEPDVILTDDHILAYTMRRGVEKNDMRNEIRAKYVPIGELTGEGYLDPALFVEAEAEPWLNQTSIDLNGVQTTTLDLLWCPSHSQARRRMKMESYRMDPAWSGEIITNAYGLDALGSRFIRVQIAELGINEIFEKLTFEANVDNAQVKMSIRSFPKEAVEWDEATEAGTQPVSTTPSVSSAIDDPDNMAVSIASEGGVLVLRLTVSDPGRYDLTLEADWTTDTVTYHPLVITDQTHGYYSPVSDGTTYTVRARFLQPSGAPSGYVTADVTADDAGFAYTRFISTDTQAYALDEDATAHGWDGAAPIFAAVFVNSGIYVGAALPTGGSPGTSGPAFYVIALPATSTVLLTNAGLIYGYGGIGGDHGDDGEDGGVALRTAYAMDIDNTGGVIAGGGGGGGGGTDPGGGGGGGGRGYDPGSGGVADTGASNGVDATKLLPGAGGSGDGGGGDGGDGGDLGDDGSDGTGGSPGIAGTAGWCTDGDSNITWIATGTRLGTLN